MDREKVEEKLSALIVQGEKVVATRSKVHPPAGVVGFFEDKVDARMFKEWALDVLSTLNAVFGAESDHYQHAERSTKATWKAHDASDLLSVVKSALTAFRFDAESGRGSSRISALDEVERFCERFHQVACQLRRRHAGRETLDVKDEYDLQDLFHALLRIPFDDVREEEWTPSFAGASSRMDFLLKKENLVIEMKMARKGLGAKELGAELLVDVGRYRAHPDCKTLVCFVYDPDGRIKNPAGVERDLSREIDGMIVRVHIRPR